MLSRPTLSMHRYRTQTTRTKSRILKFLCAIIGFIWISNFILMRILVGSQGQQYDGLVSVKINGKSSIHSSSSNVTTNTTNNQARTPIVIVPGSMGSILQARIVKKKVSAGSFCSSTWNSWYNLWLSEWALVFTSCFFDNIKTPNVLHTPPWEACYPIASLFHFYDIVLTASRCRFVATPAGNGKMGNADGVVTRVKDYGSSVEGVRCILPYTAATCEATRNWQDVIKVLETIGYQVGKDLFSAPYDFRRGPDDYMDDDYPRLKELVENIYKANNNQPVVLMSISLGSVFLHTFFTHFVSHSWKNKYIKRWLSMSGLFNGFAQSFQNTFFGRETFMTIHGFKMTDVRDAYRSWFSAIWLIPRDTYGDNRVILKTSKASYTLSDVKNILHGDQADMYSRSLLYNMSTDPGVPTDCWFSAGRKTAIAHKIKADYMTKELFYGDSPVVVEKEILGSGDGAGDLKSLKVCEQWKSTTARRFSICHGCFLYDGVALKAITELLTVS